MLAEIVGYKHIGLLYRNIDAKEELSIERVQACTR